MNQKKLSGSGFEVAFIFGDSLVFTPHTHKEYVISANLLGNELPFFTLNSNILMPPLLILSLL